MDENQSQFTDEEILPPGVDTELLEDDLEIPTPVKQLQRSREDQLLSLLLSVDNDKPTPATFHLLYEWFISYGTFSDQSEIFTQMDFFYLYFNLLQKCTISLQIEELKKFNRLLSNAPFLRIYARTCTFPAGYSNWIQRLMEDVLPFYLKQLQGEEDEDQQPLWIEFATMIEQLGNLHINELELKSMIRFFKTSAKYKDRIWGLFIESLQRIASVSQGPDVYWNFPGYPDFGIALPAINRFPSGGYTICMWLRIESFSHPQIKSNYLPHLLSLLATDGSGIEIYFVENNLCVKTDVKKKVSSEKFKYSFQPQRWYFITISHEYHLIGRSELHLYVDNQKISVPMTYPKVSDTMSVNLLGCNNKISGTYTTGRAQPFLGQIGGFYMFQESLSDGDIKAIADIAPKYFSGFNPGLSGSLGDPKLASKLIYGFSPKCVKGENCIAITSSGKLSNANPAILRGIKVVKVTYLKDTIRYIGGIKCLFPILSELINVNNNSKKLDETDFILSNVMTSNIIPQLLSLLYQLLKDSPTNQLDMLENEGFQIIGHILQQLPPQLITKDTVQSLDQLASLLSNNEILEKEFILHVLCNFNIWIFTNSLAQQELLLILRKHISNKPQYYRNFIGVQYMLDICRNYLWFKPEEFSLGREPEKSVSDSSDMGYFLQPKRPSEKDIKQLTHSILEIVFMYVKDTITLEETKSILLYIYDCKDEKQLSTLLQMTVSLQGKSTHPLTKNLVALGGVDAFIGLLQSNTESVRVWSIKAIGKILEYSQPPKNKIVPDNRYAAMKHFLQLHKITPSIYNCLLECILDMVSTQTVAKPLDQSVINSSQSASFVFSASFNGPAQYIFKNVGFLSIIFELIALSSNNELQLQVLQDFRYFLKNFSANRNVFLSQHNWQSWLLGILANVLHNQSVPLKLRNDIYFTSIEIFTLLHHQCLYQIEGLGWSNFIQTETLVVYFSERGFFDAEKICRSLYDALLKSIQADSKIIQFTVSNTAPNAELKSWEAVIKFLGHLEKFLFANSTPNDNGDSQDLTPALVYDFRLHRLSNGRWADTLLANQILEYIEVLLVKINSIPSTAPGYPALLKHLDLLLRLGLNLILASIQESIYYSNSEKIILQNQQFQQLQSFSEQERNRIKDAVVSYIKSKMSQYSSESEQTVKVLERIAKKLHVIVTRLHTLQSDLEMNKKRILYLVTFLYKCVKECNDKQSKDILQSIWRGLLPRIAPREVITNSQDIEQYFVEGFTGTSPQFSVMATQFENALRTLVEERKTMAKSMSDRINSNRQLLLQRIQKHVEEESVAQNLFDKDFNNLKTSYTTQEKERRINVISYIQRQSKIVAKKWKLLQRILTNERGPWSASSKRERIILKMDTVENTSRMRRILKRDFEGSLHSGSTIADVKLKAVQSSPLNINRTPVRKDSKEDLKDLEIEKEEILIENIPKGTILLTVAAELVQPMLLTQGSLEITSSHVYFTDIQNTMRKTWALDTITKIYGRRYVLRWSALEWFTDYGKNYFLNFSNQKDAIKVFKKIISLSSTIDDSFFANPDKAIARSNVTNLWAQRKISNFDYLMYLNSMSGRTYNDLAQYPIFPWILSDYSSSSLDLSNSAIYRDLSKPIGALNPARLKQLLERYDAFVDPLIPSFLYGSHYSSPGIVLYFLIRLEPFTTHFLTLQGGYFDYAERLFISLQSTWSACLTAPADFKELTPEFFYLPEFLTNVNGVDLGAKQDGTPIGDVILPPWAKGDPKLFVHLQREALESEYVSQHLNEWIDLIFGYKQSGKDAVAANNLFYYLSYEGATDLDSIVDETEKLSKVSHILNFGQIPSLLFRKPHPKRLSQYELGIPKQITPSSTCTPFKPRSFSDPSGIPIINIFQVGKDINIIYLDGIVSTNHISTQPLSFEIDKTVSTKPKEITLLLAPELYNSPTNISQCLGVSDDGKTLYHCGCWDDTVKVLSFSANQILSCCFDHDKLVNCIDMGVDGRTLVTGSYDTSLRIFDYSDTSKSILGNTRKRGSKLQLKLSLFAHDDKVLCISLSTQSNTLASSSADNTVNQWSTKGKLLRSLHFEKQVEIVKVTPYGDIITYSRESQELSVYSVNGILNAKVEGVANLTNIILNKEGTILATGDERGCVTLRSVETLDIIKNYEGISSPVTSMTIISDDREKYIVAGYKVGNIAFFDIPAL